MPLEILYSVVVPVHNESAGIESLAERMTRTMDGLGSSYEIIFIDDGSTDSTWDILTGLSQKNPRIKAFSFARNFGHQVAVAAGLELSRGKAVAVMDGDGQDPPEFLPTLFQKWKEQYDVVYAVRKNRKEPFLKRLSYALFYRLFKKIVPFPAPLDSGDFSVMDRRVVDFIVASVEHNPFIRGLRSWYGGRQIGVEYERPGRSKGESKYSFFALCLLAVNGISGFSKFPLRLAVFVGLFFSLSGILFALYSIVLKLFTGIMPVGYTSIITLVTVLGGFELMFLGIIAEYVGLIFDEVRKRPLYIIKQKLNDRE